MSKKYKAGRIIISIDEILRHEVVYVSIWQCAKNVQFLQNFPTLLLARWVRYGYIKEAVLVEKDKTKKTATKYRYLKKGEIIQKGDECGDPTRKLDTWYSSLHVGRRVRCDASTMCRYRRKLP